MALTLAIAYLSFYVANGPGEPVLGVPVARRLARITDMCSSSTFLLLLLLLLWIIARSRVCLGLLPLDMLHPLLPTQGMHKC